MTDVTFIVGFEKVAANKTLLALSNEVFRRQFFGEFDDFFKNEVIIADTNPVAFKHFICFLNFGETNFANDLATVKDVYELAERYLDHKLKRFCEYHIISLISYDNIFQNVSWNDLFQNQKIKAATDEFLKENFMQSLYVDKDGFNTLRKDRLLEIVKTKVLSCSEELLFNRILEWKKANEGQTIDDLLPYIKLEISKEYKIVDIFSKPSRPNSFVKQNIGDLKISEKSVYHSQNDDIGKICIGFTIILSNLYNEKFVEKFNVSMISNSQVVYCRDFVTTTKECIVIRDFLFNFPIVRPQSCQVTFERRAQRYQYKDTIIFPIFLSDISMKKFGNLTG